MLKFGWFPLIIQLLNPPVFLIILLLLYQKHQSQLVKLSPSCFIIFLNSQARSRHLSFSSHSFSFILWSAGTAKSTILQVLFSFSFFFFFFFVIIIRSGLLAEIRRSVCKSKSHRNLCESFSRTDAGLCIYHLFIWSNFKFLHISQRITLPTYSYYYYDNYSNYYYYYYYSTPCNFLTSALADGFSVKSEWQPVP